MIKKKDKRAARFDEFEVAKTERHAAFEEEKALIVTPGVPEEFKTILDKFERLYPGALEADDDMPVDDEIY